jgi:hypothetical protein
MSSFAADYTFPLCFPDINLAGIVYLKRTDISLFADYARLKGNLYQNREIIGTFTENISSFGAEGTFEANFLRFYAPVNIGFRTSYISEFKDTNFELLFSVNFTTL